jgi:hypothetical protein
LIDEVNGKAQMRITPIHWGYSFDLIFLFSLSQLYGRRPSGEDDGRMANDGTLNHLPRGMAEAVGRIGFRKWYERQLLSSHAHMVLAFLATVGLLGSLEALRGATAGEKVLNVLGVIACAAIGLWALRRYLFLLTRAEEIANQANCQGCGEYGRFKVVGSPAASEAEVRCHKCAHCWTISLGG